MPNPSYWIGYSIAHPTDSSYLYQYYWQQLYNNASKLIKINGLPDELQVEEDFIMQCLLLNGKVFLFQDKGVNYALDGSWSGDITTYYHPSLLRTTNPVLGQIVRQLDVDGSLVFLTPMDRLYLAPTAVKFPGISALLNVCAWLLADNTSSINCAQINTRAHAIYVADDSNIAKSAEMTLKEIYAGKPYSVVTKEMLSNFGVNPLTSQASSKTLTELIEMHQYILAMFWNALGIDCNSNMKRERLISAEVDKNIQGLKVPIETMLESINDGLNRYNKIFGTSMTAVMNPEFEPKEPEPISTESGDSTNDKPDDTKQNDKDV